MSPFRPPVPAANYEPGLAAKTYSSLFIREDPPRPARLRSLAVPGRRRTFVLLGVLQPGSYPVVRVGSNLGSQSIPELLRSSAVSTLAVVSALLCTPTASLDPV